MYVRIHHSIGMLNCIQFNNKILTKFPTGSFTSTVFLNFSLTLFRNTPSFCKYFTPTLFTDFGNSRPLPCIVNMPDKVQIDDHRNQSQNFAIEFEDLVSRSLPPCFSTMSSHHWNRPWAMFIGFSISVSILEKKNNENKTKLWKNKVWIQQMQQSDTVRLSMKTQIFTRYPFLIRRLRYTQNFLLIKNLESKLVTI